MHLYVRIVCCRVPYHRYFVAKFKRITDSCFHTRVCDQSDDDELMDAMFLELQIQIRVSEPTGTPMLKGSPFHRVEGRTHDGSHLPWANSFRINKP